MGNKMKNSLKNTLCCFPALDLTGCNEIKTGSPKDEENQEKRNITGGNNATNEVKTAVKTATANTTHDAGKPFDYTTADPNTDEFADQHTKGADTIQLNEKQAKAQKEQEKQKEQEAQNKQEQVEQEKKKQEEEEKKKQEEEEKKKQEEEEKKKKEEEEKKKKEKKNAAKKKGWPWPLRWGG
jgi:hypothetical protein